MNENLKTLRLLHQLLMLAAAVVFVFAFTPDPVGDYNAALDELAAVREISGSLQGYGYYVRDRLKPRGDADTKFLLSVARGTHARMSDQVPVRVPFACDFGPHGQGLVDDYYDFFTGTQSLAPLDLKRDPGVGEQLKKQVANYHPKEGDLELMAISVGGVGTAILHDGTRILDWRNIPQDPPVPQLDAQFTFHDTSSDTERVWGASLPVMYSIGKPQEGHFASDWLRTDPTGQRLIDSKSGTVFPHLRKSALWNRIRTMTPDAADTFVQARLDALKTDAMSFFGISVDKGLALWIGPAVCAGVLFFFLTHLRHVARLHDIEELSSYPWIAIFHDPMGATLTFLSVLVFPVVANSLLLLKHGSFAARQTFAGIVITGLVAVLGVWAYFETRRLRKRIAEYVQHFGPS